MKRENFLVASIDAMLISLIIANIKFLNTSISTYISVAVLFFSFIVFFPRNFKFDNLLNNVLFLVLILSFLISLESYFWFSESEFNFSSFSKNALLFYLYLFYFLFIGIFLKEYPTIGRNSYQKIEKFMYLTLQINSVFVILQFILFYLFRYKFVLTWSASTGLFTSFRPPGFFSEPAHFAEYFLLYIIAFEREFSFKDLLIITALSLCSSGLGFVVIIIFILYSILFGIKRRQKIMFWIISLIIFLTINLLFNPNIRFRLNLTLDNSLKLRFFKFFYILGSLGFQKILTGFGFAQSGLAVEYYKGPYESLFKLLPGYFSGVGNNFLMIGATCFIIIECFLLYYFLKTKGNLKGLFFYFVFLGISFVSDINFTMSIFWLPFYLILLNYFGLYSGANKNE
jgi:hypothetical protein